MPGAQPNVLLDMAEQPAVLERLLARRSALREELAPLRSSRYEGVLLVARGSSDNAASYGRYLLELALDLPAALAANSLFTRYGCATGLARWLVVAVSQSGSTPEVVDVVARTRQLGATTLAVTNDLHAPLAQTAEVAIALDAGVERAVPATKTFTATLLVFALMAELLGAVPWPAHLLGTLPGLVEDLLNSVPEADETVAKLASGRPSVHLGRGFLYSAALETALKMRETAQLPVCAYSVADFLHGPIAATTAETVAVCHVGGGATRGDGLSVIDALALRGASVLAIGPGQFPSTCSSVLPVAPVPEPLAPLLHCVRGQQLAVQVALARGVDPDAPAGLAKVTRTS